MSLLGFLSSCLALLTCHRLYCARDEEATCLERQIILSAPVKD